MNSIMTAVAIIAVIALIGAVLLVVAAKVFFVTEDERIEQVSMVLPGANCGACGYAGCAAYAKAVVEEGAPANQCLAGGAPVAERVAAVMGVDAGAATSWKAIVACQGDNEHTLKRYEYHGLPTCTACDMLYSGNSSCPFGCLGFGDCAKACKFDAITIVNGLAHVDPEKCTGCGMCRTVCPKRIIFLYEEKKRPEPVVMCSNHKRALDMRRECSVGCIGCGKCVRNCPVEAVYIHGNVARIDYDKCVGCGKCVRECPVNCLLMPPKTKA